MQTTTLRVIVWLVRTLTPHLLTTFSRRRFARTEAVGYFQIGRTPLDTGAAGKRLKAARYPAPHTEHTSWGGGNYGRIERNIVGGDGQGGGGSRRGRRLKARSGFGMGSMFGGHVAYGSDTWRVYPFAGVGGHGEGFSVQPAQRPPKTDAAPALPAGGTGGLALFAGWATEFRLRLLPQAGLLIGLRVGWMALPLGIPWIVRGFGNVRLPRPRFARPYVALMLGGYVESADRM